MNLKRLLTAIIGLPIVIILFIIGNKYMMDFIFAMIAIVGFYEYSKCASHKVHIISWVGYICAASLACLHMVPIKILFYILMLSIPCLLFVLFLHVIITDMKITFEDMAFTLVGITYIICFTAFLPLTYGIEGAISGKILIWYIIFAAWGTDTFAYLIGKNFGKRKLSKISPNKTVEGCIAGTIASVAINIGFTYFLNQYLGYHISYSTIAIIGFVLSIIGQIGDFSASVVKRYFNIKDFSKLFPGHGGMMDRIDSVMFIAPFAYCLLTMFL